MAEQKIIDIEPRFLKMVQSLFARQLPFKQVWAFGSRVKFTARQSSDLDCVVFGATDNEIAKAQEVFDESEVPFEVQLLNWETIPEDFKENIKKEYFVLRKESDWGEFLVGDLLESISNQSKIKKIKRSDYKKEGLYPVIDQSQSGISGYNNDESSLYQGKLPAIVFGDHTRVLKFIDFPFCIGADGTQILLPNLSQNVRYFYYALKNLDLKNYGYERHFKYLKQEKILIPPFQTQRKIASILSAYDDLIENNNKRIKILEEMAQMLYKEWFINFKFPNHQNTKFVDSELGRIPEGWEVRSAKKISNILIGRTPPRKETQWFSIKSDNNNIPWLSIKDFGSGGMFVKNTTEYLTKEAVAKKKVPIVKKGTVIVSFKLTVGKVAITSVDMCTNEAIAQFPILDESKITMHYLYSYLKNFTYPLLGNTSSIGNAINSTILKGMSILVPKEEIVHQYTEILKPIFTKLEILDSKTQNLRKTRDLLLPRLISGEISVENLEVKIDDEA